MDIRRFFKYLTPSKKTKLVLSFDGGGVRAIAAVVFLKQLEIASGKSVLEDEKKLIKYNPDEFKDPAHHQMILHGR